VRREGRLVGSCGPSGWIGGREGGAEWLREERCGMRWKRWKRWKRWMRWMRWMRCKVCMPTQGTEARCPPFIVDGR